ncbi:MAG: SurA N-terminal domain-containing protein [Rhodospirillales bacterium]|nr:SurA N-terminal domain-containing protein [Rhodospirillales bacterium]
MFGNFRKTLVSWGAKILIALLVLSFGVWGISDSITGLGGGSSSVATVGELEISSEEYSQQFERQVSRLRQAFGGQFTSEQARAMGIGNQVLSGIIRRSLFLEGARDMGLLVSSTQVAQEIKSDPRFNGAGGFDRERFNRMIYEAGYGENGFIEIYRNDLIEAQILSAIRNGGKAPKALVNAIYAYRMERRVAETLRIPNEKLAKIGKPSEAQLTKYHKENAKLFTAPEARDFALVRLTIKDVIDEVKVPEEKIVEAYKDRIGDFSQPERRAIEQILMDDEKTARAAHARLIVGMDFLKVATDIAKVDASTLSLGELSKEEVPLPELSEAAFSMANNTFSLPVKSSLGWHILRVTSIKPAKVSKLEDVHAKLKKEIAEELAVDALFSLANKFEDELGGGTTLADAAKRLNFKTQSFKGVNRAGTDIDGKAIAGLDPEIVGVAFETDENNDSALIDTRAGGYFMLHTNKVTPPALRPLGQIRTQVVQAWKRDQAAEAAEKGAAEILKAVKGGKSLEDAAKSSGGTFATSEPFTRSGEGLKTQIPGDLIGEMFSAKRGDAAASSAGAVQIIAALKDILPANSLSDKAGVAAIDNQLMQAMTDDLSQQLADGLRQRLGVSINQAAVDNPQSSRRTSRGR